jgi:hypothetical protein
VTKIGDVECVGDEDDSYAHSITDIAVDQSGSIWAIGSQSFFKLRIENNRVTCEANTPLKADGANGNVRFVALTFAPAGVLDPANEVLVAGNSEGALYSIAVDGTIARIGDFGVVPHDDKQGHTYKNAGKRWELSGDIVFLANGGSPIGFATVRDCPKPPSTSGCEADTLVEVDVAALASSKATDALTKRVLGKLSHEKGCAADATEYRDMFGIASWNDKVFGFSHAGLAVVIDNGSGSTCALRDSMSEGMLWTGAGVSTLAPVVAPGIH